MSESLVRASRVALVVALALDAPQLVRGQALGADGRRTDASPPSTAPSRASDAPSPLRLHELVGLPWLRFGLEHRSRFEHLAHDFRTSNPADATSYSARTLLGIELVFDPVVVGLELADARFFANDSAPRNTTLTNPFDILRAYVGVRATEVLEGGDELLLSVGRITVDLGSRRVVARNEFRNTINAFTGIDASWTSARRDLVRLFVVTPVIRRPTDALALRDNAVELDEESWVTWLAGAFYRSRPLTGRLSVEAYVLGLHEDDSPRAATSNRRLITTGSRLFVPPAAGRFDSQLEWVGQFGTSRASARDTDATDLLHVAFAVHAAAGFRFDAEGVPRLVLQYDYASGDRSPDDARNDRFDPLFGARRFDLGPTATYGAVSRSNLSSPSLRFELEWPSLFDAHVAARLIWLASRLDAWISADLRDPSGQSGFVGTQVEARLRWFPWPGNLALDVGGACLVRGDFGAAVPDVDRSPSLFVYAQMTGSI